MPSFGKKPSPRFFISKMGSIELTRTDEDRKELLANRLVLYPRDSAAGGVRRSAVRLDLQTNARDRPGCTAGTKSRVLGKGNPEAACNDRTNISRRNVAEVSFLCDEAIDQCET